MKMSRSRLAALAATLVAALSVAACGTGEAGSDSASSGGGGGGDGSSGIKGGPGVDVANKTIKVGVLTALTGPIAVIGQPTNDAYNAFVKGLNARGGIDGWKLEVVARDTQYVPEQHVRAFNEIHGDIAILNSTGAPTTKAIQQQLDQEKLITQPISFDTVWGLDPTLAPIGTPYGLEVMNAVDWQVKENGAQGKKFGMVYQNDEFGQDGLRGYDAIVKDLGLDSVAKLPYKSGDTDFTAQVQKLKSAGAQVVMATASAPSLSSMIGTAASQGYKPTWIAQSLAFTPQILSDTGTVDGKLTPAADALANDMYTSAFATPASKLPDAPGYDQLKADTEKYAPKQTAYLPYYVLAYAHAKLTAAILAKAIQNGDLSREGIYNAKTSIGKVDLEGLAADVTYSDEIGPPSRDSEIAKVDLKSEGFLKEVSPSYQSDTAKNFDFSTLEQ